MSDLLLIVFNGVLTLFNLILSLLFTPIDLILSSVIPSYSSMSTYIDNFFGFFHDNFLFVLGWLHIPSGVIDLLLGYIAFRVALFVGTLSIKYFVKWFKALKV